MIAEWRDTIGSASAQLIVTRQQPDDACCAVTVAAQPAVDGKCGALQHLILATCRPSGFFRSLRAKRHQRRSCSRGGGVLGGGWGATPGLKGRSPNITPPSGGILWFGFFVSRPPSPSCV